MEDKWHFADFPADVMDNSQTYILRQLIEDRHLKIKDLKVYFRPEQDVSDQ